MKVLDAQQTAAVLPFERLIPALRDAFMTGAEVPLRHRHDIAQLDGTAASLLLMPAWRANGLLGVKVVSVFPGNGARGLASVSASYLLCDGATGQHLALIDGGGFQDEAGRTLFSYAHPLFWAPYTIIGDGGAQ